MALVRGLYLLTEKFPREETYGLTSQLRRAAIAILSNIAEGYLRKHKKEFSQFLAIALGSAAELETQILICKSLYKFKEFDFSNADSLLIEVMKMLYVMIEKISS